MKLKQFILHDTHSLCWRAFYSTGGLSYNNTPTGVLFGFFGTVLQLEGQFGPATNVFCFDSKQSKRKRLYPDYKKRRHTHQNLTQNQIAALWDLRQQIKGLRTKYLQLVGFQNIFRVPGYEADDLIAHICQNLQENERAIIISTDSDLLQCLGTQVKLYDPRKKFLWTLQRFRKIYEIDPWDWAVVKALSGCPTDGVKGIPGIGEKTAIKFINLTLSEGSKKYHKILSQEGIAIKRRNLPLVRLPFDGLKPIKIKPDGDLQWGRVLRELGIRTLETDIEYREFPK
jgi:DNA polymerase-1